MHSAQLPRHALAHARAFCSFFAPFPPRNNLSGAAAGAVSFFVSIRFFVSVENNG